MVDIALTINQQWNKKKAVTISAKNAARVSAKIKMNIVQNEVLESMEVCTVSNMVQMMMLVQIEL